MELDSIDSRLSDGERADLAALADDSLRARRRAEVESRLQAEPGLRALVDEQRRSRDLVRAAALDVSAPAALRSRIATARRETAPRRRRLRIALGGGVAAVAAACALALVLTLPGDVPGGPTIVEAASLAGRAPTAPPPARNATQPKLLTTHVDGAAYPYWDDIKWPVAGTRVDTLHGRRVTTVFYDRNGKRVGYQILPGKRVAPPVATEQRTINGTVYRTFKAKDTTIVTWVRHGHTCVLSARNVPSDVLFKLASWNGGGQVTN